jgi:TRAP-type C4-dicarboxylate transport system permease small subunit
MKSHLSSLHILYLLVTAFLSQYNSYPNPTPPVSSSWMQYVLPIVLVIAVVIIVAGTISLCRARKARLLSENPVALVAQDEFIDEDDPF